jgi:hypothetical protein
MSTCEQHFKICFKKKKKKKFGKDIDARAELDALFIRLHEIEDENDAGDSSKQPLLD